MPSTNVQELYEKFMDDPEYIGRESLALAEAQQRVRQSINNHKALSMAKAVTPMESLLEFLIKKSVEDNIPAHFQHKYCSLFFGRPRTCKPANRLVFPSFSAQTIQTHRHTRPQV